MMPKFEKPIQKKIAVNKTALEAMILKVVNVNLRGYGNKDREISEGLGWTKAFEREETLIRDGLFSVEEERPDLQAVRAFLEGSERPEEVPRPIWATICALILTPEPPVGKAAIQALELIANFTLPADQKKATHEDFVGLKKIAMDTIMQIDLDAFRAEVLRDKPKGGEHA